MLSVDEALQKVLDTARTRLPEIRPIADTVGYVLDEDIVSEENVPPFDNSAMDGYAVISADILGTSRESPRYLKVIDVVRAGKDSGKRLDSGQAVQIMTGAPVPFGADAVVMVEQTEKADDGSVKIFTSVTPHENLRFAGDDIRKGQRVFENGHAIKAYDIGVLASIGRSSIKVVSKPKVAILSTGDELSAVESPLPPGKIRSSNNHTLRALSKPFASEVLDLGIAEDNLDDTEARLREAFSADIVLTSGGVSMGEFDFVRKALENIGIDIHFWKVKQKPGKPLVFGTHHDQLFFGLPGNPVSCAVCFELYVIPAIQKMSGFHRPQQRRLRAVTSETIKKKPGLRFFLRGVLKKEGERYVVRTTGNQSSGVLSSLSNAHGLIDLPEDRGDVMAGEEVDVILFHHSINELLDF